MARKQKLKVFRTPIGFHDAYVAAPSQKAALTAWGADSNIFAQGIAEQVDGDSEAAAEALAAPGSVIRKLRGSADEHVQALGSHSSRSRSRTSRPLPRGERDEEAPSTRARSRAGRPPAEGKRDRGRKPSRAGVAKAEAALEVRERRHRAELRKLDEQAEALRRRRRDLDGAYKADRKALKEAAESEQERYERAMERWQQ